MTNSFRLILTCAFLMVAPGLVTSSAAQSGFGDNHQSESLRMARGLGNYPRGSATSEYLRLATAKTNPSRLREISVVDARSDELIQGVSILVVDDPESSVLCEGCQTASPIRLKMGWRFTWATVSVTAPGYGSSTFNLASTFNLERQDLQRGSVYRVALWPQKDDRAAARTE